MNNDLSGLTQQADPNEVIAALQTALAEKSEEIKRMRADINGFAEWCSENKYYSIPERKGQWALPHTYPHHPWTTDQLYYLYLQSKQA